MRRLFPLALCLLLWWAGSGCRERQLVMTADQIIALERSALDKWGKGNPRGYLDLYASDITYFDPFVPLRVDGHGPMEKLLMAIEGKISIDRYEMLNPSVQVHGDTAILTYNLVSYGRRSDGAEQVMARWNSTAIYASSGDTWKLVHSHWSFTRPELKEPSSEATQG
jgi:ketosteroid isomerase-like protein